MSELLHDELKQGFEINGETEEYAFDLNLFLKRTARALSNMIALLISFPSQHWLKIRTNNVIERMNREIRRRTRVVGAFPDGNSALMLVCARLRYVAGKDWGSKRYLCMKCMDYASE